MEQSILTSTKKILNIPAELAVFDLDVMIHINSVFSFLHQLGVGPENGFQIEDATPVWSDFIGDDLGMNMVRSYVFLKVRMLFDPPTTSFLLTAMGDQIKEFEYRISALREWNLDPVDPMTVVVTEEV